MSEKKPVMVIARSKREADSYAYSNGIPKHIFINSVASIKAADRGLDYVYVPECLYMMSQKLFWNIEESLKIGEHKAV